MSAFLSNRKAGKKKRKKKKRREYKKKPEVKTDLKKPC